MSASDTEKARKLVALEETIRGAVAAINKASLELHHLKKDVKLRGWNWERPGTEASVSPQGSLNFSISDFSSPD